MDNANSSWTPKEGMEFSNLEEAWNFWRFYGGKMGFNVRKHYANKSKKDNVVTSRRFLCSKQGHRENDKRDHLVIEPRSETRTDCPARMGITLNRSTGKYYVHDFIPEHNHILHYTECTHMLSSQRTITDVQAFEVQIANDSGLILHKKILLTSLVTKQEDEPILGSLKQIKKIILEPDDRGK